MNSILVTFARVAVLAGVLGTGSAVAEPLTTTQVREGYAKYAALAQAYRWYQYYERSDASVDNQLDILDEDVVIKSSLGEASGRWFRGPASSVAASTHGVENFSVKTVAENVYEVRVEFPWQGLLPDGNEMVARTAHTWTVEDDPVERFARVKVMAVKLLEPFAPKP